jgi:hypothetical protein
VREFHAVSLRRLKWNTIESTILKWKNSHDAGMVIEQAASSPQSSSGSKTR